MNHNMVNIFVYSAPPDNLSIQEFQKNEAIDVEVRYADKPWEGCNLVYACHH